MKPNRHPTPSSNHEQLLRLLDGTLTPEEEARVRQDLARSPALQAELDALHTMRELLQTTVHASAQRALQPFFVDRLLRRLTPEAEGLAALDEEFFGLLLRWFRPVALAGVLLILGFATYNVVLSDTYETAPSATEAVLGLPPVTLTTAYTLNFETIPPIDYEGTD